MAVLISISNWALKNDDVQFFIFRHFIDQSDDNRKQTRHNDDLLQLLHLHFSVFKYNVICVSLIISRDLFFLPFSGSLLIYPVVFLPFHPAPAFLVFW